MSSISLSIWGRKFELQVKYDCYKGEFILDNQVMALKTFVEKADELLVAPDEIIDYCLNNNGEEIENNKIDNIFKYVIPTSLYISRTENTRNVAILCNYKFDIEHGIAIVYENEQLKEIGSQDIIL